MVMFIGHASPRSYEKQKQTNDERECVYSLVEGENSAQRDGSLQHDLTCSRCRHCPSIRVCLPSDKLICCP